MKTVTILTYCSGYPYEIFRRFVGSLFDSGFGGNLYIFSRECDRENLDRLVENGYSRVKYFIVEPSFHICNSRYEIFLEKMNFLPKTDLYLITDSRDVLFQKNIEEFPFEDDHELILFSEGRKIKECHKYNMKWIKMIEPDRLESLKNKEIISAGTTIGTFNGVLNYLRNMVFYINSLPEKTRNTFGADQAIHNILAHSLLYSLINAKIMRNEDRLVNTICEGFKNLYPGLDKIVDSNGQISYIVHQYDRLDEYSLKAISKKYDFVSRYIIQ